MHLSTQKDRSQSIFSVSFISFSVGFDRAISFHFYNCWYDFQTLLWSMSEYCKLKSNKAHLRSPQYVKSQSMYAQINYFEACGTAVLIVISWVCVKYSRTISTIYLLVYLDRSSAHCSLNSINIENENSKPCTYTPITKRCYSFFVSEGGFWYRFFFDDNFEINRITIINP